VSDVSVATADLAALLDVSPPAVMESDEARVATLITPRGAIVLKQPSTQTGPLADAVAVRGDHLYAATLATMPQGGEPAYRADLAHGANLTFEAV